MTNTTDIGDLSARMDRLEEAFANLVRSSDSREVSDDHQALFDALKQWRYEVAQAEDVKAFVVMGNATLAAIATTRPVDRFELSQIKNFGPKRMEKYGGEVIGIVASHGW